MKKLKKIMDLFPKIYDWWLTRLEKKITTFFDSLHKENKELESTKKIKIIIHLINKV